VKTAILLQDAQHSGVENVDFVGVPAQRRSIKRIVFARVALGPHDRTGDVFGVLLDARTRAQDSFMEFRGLGVRLACVDIVRCPKISAFRGVASTEQRRRFV